MCGIIGYVGFRQAATTILKALKNLEYRGYDSVGIAVEEKGRIRIVKDKGRIADFEKTAGLEGISGTVGIGHTRWATHGVPNQVNAHPHSDCHGKTVIIHNGIIENFESLKEQLAKAGHRFKSDTDTEVIAHLIESQKEDDFESAFVAAARKIEGTYSIVAIRQGDGRIICSRKSSPLIIGIGKKEMFCASDMPAVLDYTNEFVILKDGEYAVLDATGHRICELQGGRQVKRRSMRIDWTRQMAQKDGFAHFMIKEIHQQQSAIRLATTSGEYGRAARLLDGAKMLRVVACGSSYHAGLVFKNVLERLTDRHVEVSYASEFMHLPNVGKGTVVIAISQSGETADTMAAVRLAKERGAKVLAVCNVVGSSLTREADLTLYLNAGPEIAVVATKSFTSQLALLYKLVFIVSKRQDLEQGIADLSSAIDAVLTKAGDMEKLAEKLCKSTDFFFIGRGLSHATALEGALKLKEITYLHAESYPAGELKHGPLSLLEGGVKVVAIAPGDETRTKIMGNIKECQARNAEVIVFSDDKDAARLGTEFALLPKVDPIFSPILFSIPLQLLAYYISVKKGCDPDKPRNLAKSVTVE
ncbi:glutamine--fructose-6-phosphate transaminase (isomerizing) [Candidatus Parvarchaeota archaeon]|nr:glutamine--fructose-6-phosphate transaminase (isomerizing) [Candidatus Parvarchaeota archaeon]